MADVSTRVLGIIGSSKRRTPTERLVRRVLDAAEGNGAATESIHLSALDIEPCRGCKVCAPEGRCRLRDEMPYERMASADAIVLGLAKENGHPPQCVTDFLGRWRAFIDLDGVSRLEPFRIRVSIISVVDGGASPGDHPAFIRPLERHIKRTSLTYVGSLLGTEHDPLLEDCTSMGLTLSRAAGAGDARRVSASCRQIVRMLADHIDGTLPIADLRAFRRHIDSCPTCRALFSSYETLVRIAPMASLADDDVPHDVSARLRRSLGIESRQ